MIDAYLIRTRLFNALGVPKNLAPILHAWAVVENRAFCHEFMAQMLHLAGSERQNRQDVRRKLNALSFFQKSAGLNFGPIDRKGNVESKREPTAYGTFALNKAVSFIQERCQQDPDNKNPFVVVDRYTEQALALVFPPALVPAQNVQKREKKVPKKREKDCSKNQTRNQDKIRKEEWSSQWWVVSLLLGYNFAPLPSGSVTSIEIQIISLLFGSLFLLSDAFSGIPTDSTVFDALKLARQGFKVFPVWGTADGICFCKLGSECENIGKHPSITHWQQTATSYAPLILKLWKKFPYANIGIATGVKMANGQYLTALDVDKRHFGHGSLAHLESSEICPLPRTRETANGSSDHYFYTYPRSFRIGAGVIGRGVDIQGYGKFIVGPGSTHKSGRKYELAADRPIARLPEAWVNHIDAICNKTLPMVPEGQRRAHLLRWAGAMVGAGKPFDLIFETLKDRRKKRLFNGDADFSDSDLRRMIEDFQSSDSRKKVEQVA